MKKALVIKEIFKITICLIILLSSGVTSCLAQEMEYSDERGLVLDPYYPSPQGIYKTVYVTGPVGWSKLVVSERSISALQNRGSLFVNAGRDSGLERNQYEAPSAGFSSALVVNGLVHLRKGSITINNAHYQDAARSGRGIFTMFGGCGGSGSTPQEAAITAPGGMIKFNGVYDNLNSYFPAWDANVIFAARANPGGFGAMKGISYRVRYDVANPDNKRCFNGYYEAAIVQKDTAENYYVPVDPGNPPPGVSLWRICVRHADEVPLWDDHY